MAEIIVDSSVSIAGLDKAEVLAALFNGARAQGLGFLDPLSSKEMTREDAAEILGGRNDHYFDYLRGRVMKVDLSTDSVDPWGYDRDNGQGAAQSVIDSLRAA